MEVPPERLARWLTGFAERHGGAQPHGATLTGGDGETAEFHLLDGEVAVDTLPAAAEADRRIGLLLVRRGGFAVGVAAGTKLVASKVDTKYVQSRTAAGGWSQQRFARRRDNQTRQIWDAAADVAARLLLPAGIETLVCGGDRRAVDEILTDARLAPVARLRAQRFLDVADPRLAVLEAAIGQARAVRILLRGPS